jgi:diaminopimelate decarboxylase
MTRRTFSQQVADERFTQVARLSESIAGRGMRIVRGYSVKTNPHERMLATALRHGFYAEVISDDEARWAETCGFAPGEMIYNGPRPPAPRSRAFGFVFADSLEGLARARALGLAELMGIRLRPSTLTVSRFGIPVEEDDALAELLCDVRSGVGISMHARRGDLAGATWRDLCEDLIRRATRLEHDAGCEIVAFDVGGGWQPSQFDREFPADGAWLVRRLRTALPSVQTLVIEPGQAIATPVESIETVVLEVRRRSGRVEAVVDLGHGDWPSKHEYAHRIAVARGNNWLPIGAGGDRLSGCTCLEYDYVDGLQFPGDIAPGDRVLVRDAGSYDRSMSFPFARGRLPDTLGEVAEA